MTYDELPDRFLARRFYAAGGSYPIPVPCDGIAVQYVRPDRTGYLNTSDDDYNPYPVVAAYDLRPDGSGAPAFVVERIDGVFVIR